MLCGFPPIFVSFTVAFIVDRFIDYTILCYVSDTFISVFNLIYQNHLCLIFVLVYFYKSCQSGLLSEETLMF